MGSAEAAAPTAPAGPAIEPNLPTQRAALPAATAAGLIYLGATSGEFDTFDSPTLAVPLLDCFILGDTRSDTYPWFLGPRVLGLMA